MTRTLLVSLAAAHLVANAADLACTARDFRGVYIFHAQGSNVTNNTPVTFAGSLTANGNGKITAWKDTAVAPAAVPIPPAFKLVTPVLDRYQEALSLGVEILYSVEPDCRITITTTFLGPTGNPSPVVWVGGLASGGDEALLMNASAQSPFITVVTLKRAARNAGHADSEK